MSWSLLICVILGLGFTLAALGARRGERMQMKAQLEEVETARRRARKLGLRSAWDGMEGSP